VKVKVYVEGGGDGQALQTRCRRGFSLFFERAGLRGRMPAIVACGSRIDAYDSFCTAVRRAGPDDFPLLLVDSEAEVHLDPWEHLNDRDHWQQPPDSTEEQAQLMVQCMEAWFLADREHLAKFFGHGFTERPLPANQAVEQIAKRTVFQALKMATRNSKTKGKYGKGEHSFEILAGLDPVKVRAASPHAERLLVTLAKKC
jgi:hypothetical protein